MKKILVGVDHSPRTAEVLAAAVELASRTGAKLILFRAVTIPSDPMPEAVDSDESFGTLLERRALAEVVESAKAVPSELVLGCEAEFGVPWEVICKKAKQHDVDCIVIGSQGHGVVDRLLGTTAAKVVNHADRSVMEIRDARRFAA